MGTSVRPLAGEVVAGDACASMRIERGALVLLCDGLGHGPRAAHASQAFVESVTESPSLPMDELFARAHRALVKTRGAVAAVARIDETRGELEIAGIGNVAMLLIDTSGRSIHPVTVHGVLGSAYRAVRPQIFPFGIGDMLILHSDGIRSRFEFFVLRAMNAQTAADALMRTGAKPSDDAACVVARGVPFASAAQRMEPTGPPPSRVVPVRVPGDAACAAEETRAFAKRIGLGARAQWEASIAASELATNVLKFATEGVLALRHVLLPREGLEMEMTDSGLGIADIAAARVDGFSEGAMRTPDRPRREGQGLGVGLGSVYRMMDDVEVEADAARGTRIVARKYC